MPISKRTALALDAVRLALASLRVMPDSKEARALREACVSWERVVKDWEHSAPTAEDRERAMKRLVALHVAVTKLRRRSESPPEES